MSVKKSPILFYEEKQPYFEFSNFYPSSFFLDGAQWPTVEHYFQSQKFSNPEYKEWIRVAATPYIVFKLGRQEKMSGYHAKRTINKNKDAPRVNDVIEKYKKSAGLNKDWNDIKLDVMFKAVKAKFTQNKRLHDLLMSTDDRELVENSPRDDFWGIGSKGTGSNYLGKILMKIRQELREPSRCVEFYQWASL